MALILDGTDGITSSGGTNVLQDDAVITANIADGAVTMPKIGAAGNPGAGNFLRGDGAWEAVDIEGEIEAFASGESGQPRLVGNAASEFPGTYPVLTVTASNDFSVNSGLGTVVDVSDASGLTTFFDGTRHTINKYTGSINFRIGLENLSTSNGEFEVRVLKNGNVIQTFSNIMGGPLTETIGPVNISVVPGDDIFWQFRRTGGTFVVFRTLNGSNTASNGYVLRELFASAV